jgi:hypothetical protein
MLTNIESVVTLEGLVERAWTVPFDVGRSPRGLGVSLTPPSFYDRHSPALIREGAILLAVGIDVNSSEAIELLRVAGIANAAAVVFKNDRPINEHLSAASDESGVALLGVRPEVAWEELYVMLQTAMVSPDATMPEAHGDDLFALANALAAMVGGPVVIDDPYMRVLAYSAVDRSVDDVRRDSILGRSLSPEWRKRLEDHGVFKQLWTPGQIVHLSGVPAEGFAPRIAIAIRSGTSILGAIWVAQGERGFDATTEKALREVAKSAVLPLLRYRLAHDVTDRARQNTVKSVLDGHASREILIRKLGFADRGYLAVIAVAVSENASDADILRSDLAQHLLELQMESLHAGGLASVLEGRILYILLQFETLPLKRDLEIAVKQSLASAGKVLHSSLQAGIGSLVTTLQAVPLSKNQSTEALDVLIRDKKYGAVAIYDDVRAHSLLASLTRILRDRADFGLTGLERLYALDQDQETEYLATLRAYFDAMGDVSAAASALHIHQNTFRYRMRRLGDLSGIRLADPVERFVVELHLRSGLYGLADSDVVRSYN